MKRLTEITSNLSLIAGLFASLSIVKLTIFFRMFGISITHFIELSEILIIFTEDIILIIIAILLPKVFGYIEEIILNEKEQRQLILYGDMEEIWRRRLKQFTSSRNGLLLILFLIWISLLIPAINGNRFEIASASLATICLLVMTILILFERWLLNVNNKHELISYTFPILVFLISLFLIGSSAIFDAEKVYNGNYIGTEITTTDSSYVSDSSHFYIGRTNQYTFIFNKPDKSSTILPNSEIKMIKFKSKSSIK